MDHDAASPTVFGRGTAAAARAATPGGADGDPGRLLERLNQAVRLPEESGGLPAVVRLLDQLAASEAQGTHQVWIPDTNGRLAPSMMLREGFPAPDIHVVASQYGEDAHRRGWLRLDRTLTSAEHADVVERALTWSQNDRSLHELVAEFGPPSVTFGSTDPDRPKTVSYVTDDRTAPVAAFHFGSARTGAAAGTGDGSRVGAVLLGVRVHDDFLGGWELTPFGEDRFC